MRRFAWFLSALLGLAGAAYAEPPREDADVKVVSQGSVTVTLGDVDQYLQRVPEDRRPGFIASPKRIESVLRAILRTKQLARQARQMKLDPTLDPNDDIDRPLPLAREEDLARRRLEQFTKDLVIPDLNPLAREVYAANLAQYFIPERAEVQQVLIAIAGRSPAEARERAEKVHALALADPAGFDGLVEEYSDDPAKDQTHGRLEISLPPNASAPIEQAIAALHEPGAVSSVVCLPKQCRVFKLLHRTPGRQRSFDEVKDQLLEDLRKQYVQNQRQGLLDELTSLPIDANPEVIANLPARYGVPRDFVPPPEPPAEAAPPAKTY